MTTAVLKTGAAAWLLLALLSATAAAGEYDNDPDLETFASRKQFLQEVIARPEAGRLEKVVKVLRNRMDPLSSLAAMALSRIGGTQAEKLLLGALEDSRANVRGVAVRLLAEQRATEIAVKARHLLQNDPDVSVQASAAVALGIVNDTESLGLLREILRTGSHALQFAAASALARMGEEAGFLHLETLALAGEPGLSAQAVAEIGAARSPRGTRALFQCLFSPNSETWIAGLRELEQSAPEDVDHFLAGQPPVQRSRLKLQLSLRRCLLGLEKMPPECVALALGELPDDQMLALKCMAVAGSVNSLPAAVDCLDSENAAVCKQALEALKGIAARHKLTDAPKTGASVKWREWWFGQYRISACTKEEAVLALPGGETRQVRRGTRLDWGAEVGEIKPGDGKTPLVVIFLGHEPYYVR